MNLGFLGIGRLHLECQLLLELETATTSLEVERSLACQASSFSACLSHYLMTYHVAHIDAQELCIGSHLCYQFVFDIRKFSQDFV